MNWSEFFSMGGYAFYVWGSYLSALLVLGGEVVLLMKRQQNMQAGHARPSLAIVGFEGKSHETSS